MKYNLFRYHKMGIWNYGECLIWNWKGGGYSSCWNVIINVTYKNRMENVEPHPPVTTRMCFLHGDERWGLTHDSWGWCMVLYWVHSPHTKDQGVSLLSPLFLVLHHPTYTPRTSAYSFPFQTSNTPQSYI